MFLDDPADRRPSATTSRRPVSPRRTYYDPAIPDLTSFEGRVVSADRSRALAQRCFALPIHGRLTDPRSTGSSPPCALTRLVVNPGDAVILVGAAAFAEDVTDVCRAAGVRVAAWIEGIDRDRADVVGRSAVLWVDDQAAYEPGLPILPAIGAVARRGIVERLVGEGRSLATLVHPSAVVAASATIEPGCVILPLVVVGARSRIGRGTIVNRGALIGHHTTIGEYAFVGPGANIGGQGHDRVGCLSRHRFDRPRRADHRGGSHARGGAVAVGDVAPASRSSGSRPAHGRPMIRRRVAPAASPAVAARCRLRPCASRSTGSRGSATCPRSSPTSRPGVAAVVDPRRDVDVYLDGRARRRPADQPRRRDPPPQRLRLGRPRARGADRGDARHRGRRGARPRPPPGARRRDVRRRVDPLPDAGHARPHARARQLRGRRHVARATSRSCS